MRDKLVNLYKTNAKFHSFVTGLEGALVGALVTYKGGVPNSKTALAATASFFGAALWGWFRKWLIDAQ